MKRLMTWVQARLRQHRRRTNATDAPIDPAVRDLMLSEGWMGAPEQMANGERRAPDGTLHPIEPDESAGPQERH